MESYDLDNLPFLLIMLTAKGENMSGTPYIGFGNEQLDVAPSIGKTAKCKVCGADVPIQESSSLGLESISHCGKTWLVGFKGKSIENIKPKCSGKI